MKVRCISPHGGSHYGKDHHGQPVGPGYDGPLSLDPNPGGYIDNAAVSPYPVPVGSVLDAPDGYVPDGYHFEAAAGGDDEGEDQ